MLFKQRDDFKQLVQTYLAKANYEYDQNSSVVNVACSYFSEAAELHELFPHRLIGMDIDKDEIKKQNNHTPYSKTHYS